MTYPMNNMYGSNYNMPTNPYLVSNFNQNANGTQLVRVNGIDGARAFQMQPNSTVALFDNNEDVMYVKVTDGANFPTIRKFSFTEIAENEDCGNNDNWVSREEFEQFKREVTDIGKQFIQFTKSDNECSENKSATTTND